MDKIYFPVVEVNGHREDNHFFYLSEEEAKKETESKIQDELRCIQKILSDYNLDTPIMKQVLKTMKISIRAKEFALTEERAS